MKTHYADWSCWKSCNTSLVTWDIQKITCMFCLNKLGIQKITYKWNQSGSIFIKSSHSVIGILYSLSMTKHKPPL